MGKKLAVFLETVDGNPCKLPHASPANTAIRSRHHGGDLINSARVRSTLAERTPGGGATADGSPLQNDAMCRTWISVGPSRMVKPASWRIRESRGNASHRATRHEPESLPQPASLIRREASADPVRSEAGSPENLISHPVAYARKTLLVQQCCFDRIFSMPVQKLAHPFQGELAREDRGRQCPPPDGKRRLAIQPNTAELPRIAENQALIPLCQDEMVMAAGEISGGFNAKTAGHAEMHAKPEIFGELKEHLFSMRLRTNERGFDQDLRSEPPPGIAKNPASPVRGNSRDFGSDSRIPLPPIVIHLRQFRHGSRLRVNGEAAILECAPPMEC